MSKKYIPHTGWKKLLSSIEQSKLEKLDNAPIPTESSELKADTFAVGKVEVLRQERAEKTVNDLERVRSQIGNTTEVDQDNNVQDVETVTKAIKEDLRKDIQDYLQDTNTKTEFLYKLRSFYKSKWGRYTRLAVGSGLTLAGLTSIAVGFLPGALVALAGRVLMSATGSAIVAQELQEGAALHKETSKTELSKTKKAWGFLRRKSIELDGSDVEKLSVYEARKKLSKMVAQAHAIGSDLSDHKQEDAIELLAKKAVQIPQHRKLQLIMALNKRLTKQGQRANWEELELMISERVANNKNLHFNAITFSANKYKDGAEKSQKNRKKNSLMVGAGMGIVSALTGFNKLIDAKDAVNSLGDIADFVETENKVGKPDVLVPTSPAETQLPASKSDLPALTVGQIETGVSTNLNTDNMIDYPVSREAYSSYSTNIHSNFATTLSKEEASLVRWNAMSSDLLSKAFGDDGENLSAKLNFATKLHRGDLEIVDVVNDTDGKWMTYYEDGKNALGVKVADARYVRVKVDFAGEVIDANVDKAHEGEVYIPQSTPTVEVVEMEPVKTPTLTPEQNVESIEEVVPVKEIEVAPTMPAPQIETVEEIIPVKEVDLPHTPETIYEVNPIDTIKEVEVPVIEPETPAYEEIPQVDISENAEQVEIEAPQIDANQSIEQVEVEAPRIEIPEYDNIPEKDFEPVPVEQNYEEAIPHKSWDEKVVEPTYDEIPQKDISIEQVEVNDDTIPAKPF